MQVHSIAIVRTTLALLVAFFMFAAAGCFWRQARTANADFRLMNALGNRLAAGFMAVAMMLFAVMQLLDILVRA